MVIYTELDENILKDKWVQKDQIKDYTEAVLLLLCAKAQWNQNKSQQNTEYMEL